MPSFVYIYKLHIYCIRDHRATLILGWGMLISDIGGGGGAEVTLSYYLYLGGGEPVPPDL